MRRVTLLFPDKKSLWAFAQAIQGNNIQINSTERKLTCSCSDADVSKGIMQYNAEIVYEVEDRNHKH